MTDSLPIRIASSADFAHISASVWRHPQCRLGNTFKHVDPPTPRGSAGACGIHKG